MPDPMKVNPVKLKCDFTNTNPISANADIGELKSELKTCTDDVVAVGALSVLGRIPQEAVNQTTLSQMLARQELLRAELIKREAIPKN